MTVQDLDRIEQKLDHAKAGAIVISDNVGGLLFNNMAEIMEFSKLMSLSRGAVPQHLRGNPGACLAVAVQAAEWRMSPFAVANKSYYVNDRIAYEAQLIHAVIEARAPLKERLRYVFSGEGPTRRCKVIGHFKGETTPVDIETPMWKDIKVKNSPLWTSDPDQQFRYYGARSFSRAYCPDVLLGIYSVDELEAIHPERVVDITPGAGDKSGLAARLTGRSGAGFSKAGVEDAIAGPQSAAQAETPAAESQPVTEVQAEVNKPAAEVLPPDNSQNGQLALDSDVENEIADKKKAVENCDTLDDLKVIAKEATAYIKKAKRKDLLADFLSVVSEREKQILAADAAADKRQL